MVLTIDEIKEKVTPIAKKYGIKEVYLFGSYARGEADENSDIDLAYSSNHFIKAIALEVELENSLGIPVDLVNLEQILSADSPIGKRVKQRFEREELMIS
nr:nucleotidyltransferase domain-containing protein [Lactococcus piscium]